MTLTELYQLLKQSGIPVTYSHYEEGAAPELPYICYLEVGTSNFFSEDTVYKKVIDVDIELYFERKDLALEERLEQLLNGIPWNATEVYINDEKLYQKTYEVRLL